MSRARARVLCVRSTRYERTNDNSVRSIAWELRTGDGKGIAVLSV